MTIAAFLSRLWLPPSCLGWQPLLNLLWPPSANGSTQISGLQRLLPILKWLSCTCPEVYALYSTLGGGAATNYGRMEDASGTVFVDHYGLVSGISKTATPLLLQLVDRH